MIIREAQPADAPQIAPLMNLIYDEMELTDLEDVPEPDLLKAITAAYRTRTYLSGPATTVVAEANGHVVGMAFGYPGEREEAVDDVFTQITAKSAAFDVPFETQSETAKGEWYLDSLAVSPDHQGKGIGHQLLRALPHYARRDNQAVIGLNVDLENPAAMRLYKRMGYEVSGKQMIGDHHYYHMQLEIGQRARVAN
ncbi:GNAT family N-acetyltransferase [Levilactobacillus parabrevis]|uniref:GNAT family N-acetyltransferase n=1 Tax=Levilactobacillus parabrevis TaxID=357278 RepID=UPI0021A6CE0F|nr:GNAT family N-acetyltransferase [Levilactobacillus parabrevis]MCT4487182.1 GNAT family N-acetyltransferase [Levilactobacillus parabrevis]MCT4490875.1 GNAT family N-acetyltransferase [Levilactobacillus parabrevis]